MVRLAELMGSLSLATDLADGFSLEKCLRTTVLGTRLARRTGGDERVVRDVFWTCLLRFTGCTAFAHEEGSRFAAGDDLSLRRTLAMVDFGRPLDFVGRAVRGVAPGAPAAARALALGRLLATPSAPGEHARAQCDAGVAFAAAVELPAVGEALRWREERWDGKGPRSLGEGEALPLAARIADVADVAELFTWHHGAGRALEELRRRRGGSLQPALVDAFVAGAPELLEGVFEAGLWERFLEAEPGPVLAAGPEDGPGPTLGRTLVAFARFADLASVYTLGHAEAVAGLAEAAAGAAGLPAEARQLARHAGLTHDLGRVAVPQGIWEKRGPLSAYEWERVRSHSQATETILRLSPALAPVAEVAAQAHERAGGQGYHRRLPLSGLSQVARLLAAADVAVALGSARPHRPALPAGEVAATLGALARSGELDREAVEAVLAAREGRPGRRRPAARGLSDREREVVRLVAVGRTNKEVGALLGISPRTAQRHVMNAYDKLGVESRAGLALRAMELGLLEADRD